MSNYIYKFYDINNNLLYIGKTNNLNSRFAGHKSDKPWWNEVYNIEYAECKTKTDMDIYEIYYINKFNPKYNTASVNNDSPIIQLKELNFKQYNLKKKNNNKTITVKCKQVDINHIYVENNNYSNILTYNLGILNTNDKNTMQIPFMREGRNLNINIVDYIWYTTEYNSLIKRGIRVFNNSHILTLREYDTFMSLLQLFINSKRCINVCNLILEPINDYLNIKTSIYEVSKQLGYNNIGGGSRNKILESIEILSSTYLSSIYSGGIYDYKNKKYIENDSEQIKLFSINNKELNYIDIQLSKFTYNLLLNNINYLNNIYIENNINKTRNILSRRIYYLVSLWKCGSDILITDLYTLSKYIPAIDLEEKFKKREIIDALENLDSNKIININYKDRDNIIFNFKVGA